MHELRRFIRVALLVLPLASAACRSHEPADPSGPDGSGVPPSPERPDEPQDAASPLVDAGHAHEDSGPTPPTPTCETFEDRTDATADRELTWDFTFPTTNERCLLVKVGQTVTFTNGAGEPADFRTHSVQASDGDHPSPIEDIDRTTGRVTFPDEGTYGFYCVDHRQMRGAIRAVR